MLTAAQLDALDSFIGEDGLYIETIREAAFIDSGAKQLYLGRAVSRQKAKRLEQEKTILPAMGWRQKLGLLVNGVIIHDGAAFAEVLRTLTPEQSRELLRQDNFFAFREASNLQVRARPQ